MNNQLIAEYYHKITPGSVSFIYRLIQSNEISFFRLWLFNIKVILLLQVLVNYKGKAKTNF